jgi:hypothetical protein
VDTTQVGLAAARLMDELGDELPDGAEVLHVTLVAVCELPETEGRADSVFFSSTTSRRLEQIGALHAAAHLAIEAPADDE